MHSLPFTFDRKRLSTGDFLNEVPLRDASIDMQHNLLRSPDLSSVAKFNFSSRVGCRKKELRLRGVICRENYDDDL